MVTRVSDDPEIYRVHITLQSFYQFGLNIYVLKTPTENLVVDCGLNSSECKKKVDESLKKLDLDPSCTSLFLTHFHPEHMGLVDEFVARGCPVYISEPCYYRIRDFVTDTNSNRLVRFYEKEGMPARRMIDEVPNFFPNAVPTHLFPARTLHDHDTLRIGNVELQCILSQGHTPGHMMLYSPEYHFLFSGDSILYDNNPNISLWPETPDPLAAYMQGLHDLRSLNVDKVYPGHGDVGLDFASRVNNLIDHYHNQLQQMKDSMDGLYLRGLTAFQIAGRIFETHTGKEWDRQPGLLQLLISWEALSLLTHMVNEGDIDKVQQGDVMVYR